MLDDSTGTATTTASPFIFQPPAGGDLTLRSCDGTTFQVHSILLGLASTVFAGMLTGATKSDTVGLAEDAETISLMLAFIYPVTPPQIATLDRLEKVMLLSQKYDIAKVIEYIEKGIRPESELIHDDPIRLLRASTKYGFPTLKLLSVQALRPRHCDVVSIPGFTALAQHFPEAAPVIGLIGAQVVRRRLMSQIMDAVGFKMSPWCEQAHASGSGDRLPYMACRKCWDKSRRSKAAQYAPGWLRRWSRMVELKLIEDPMHKCEDFFSIVCFTDHSIWPFGNQGCSDCVAQTLTRRSKFEEWAQVIKKYIEGELKVLDVLYAL